MVATNLTILRWRLIILKILLTAIGDYAENAKKQLENGNSAIENLISNAVKYTSENGRITYYS